ncbi:Histone-lysine N-methyltransferase SETMAR like protein [Argiope bruennichi]|uniref:Histone-lysine N-methyltransferase SETMAR like protein n=1 Tax=Argiope bruennichi TaxID=94029 RepID=A0A8T0FXB9_ARGBR|nr:Histone-lysine N-methyltransferase SETMAR like protein [Argiope bruennichi]
MRVADFKRGRTSNLDAERSGRPKPVTADEIIRKVHKNLMNDRLMKLTVVAQSFEKGRTINAEFYTNLLDKLHSKIKEKRPYLAKKECPASPGQCTVHKAVIVMAKLPELKFEIVPHDPYSPDMVLSDYNLFPNMKQFLAGRKFCSDIEVIPATNAYFEALEESCDRERIQALPYS